MQEKINRNPQYQDISIQQSVQDRTNRQVINKEKTTKNTIKKVNLSQREANGVMEIFTAKLRYSLILKLLF